MYLCTNLKLTVWHNWFNWVHTAWSCKTYKQFVANFGATTGVIYIRSFPNFFRPSSSSCRANGANITLSSRFLYLAYIVWLFDPLFSLVCFSGLYIYIYILARQFSMRDILWVVSRGAFCRLKWQSETNCWVVKSNSGITCKVQVFCSDWSSCFHVSSFRPMTPKRTTGTLDWILKYFWLWDKVPTWSTRTITSEGWCTFPPTLWCLL